MPYAELHTLTCYSFLRGASHPQELVERAAELGYQAIAITDECSLAGVVKAHVAARQAGIQLIIGSELNLVEGVQLVALAPSRAAYSELSGLISLARRRSPKGEYRVALRDVIFHLKRCLIIWKPAGAEPSGDASINPATAELGYGQQLARLCRGRIWLGLTHLLGNDEVARYGRLHTLAQTLNLPMVACGAVQMHVASRKPLHDVFTALHHNTSVAQLGRRRLANSQQHLR
ncbi:MAG TPA: error-prone DNA polymerase, partial [Halieaceae bacterium]|nr:error-prone DNA polymerase [Halieaceae bacterium]